MGAPVRRAHALARRHRRLPGWFARSFIRQLLSSFVKVDMVRNPNWLCYCQGVYYYFYQIFRNRAEAKALERSRRGLGDGSVGMLQSLTVAALSG